METDHNYEKHNNSELKEVVYLPAHEEKNDSKLLRPEHEVTQSDSGFLYVSAFAAEILAFACGCSLSWTSPVFPKLKDANPQINPLGEGLTAVQESWIAGIICLGGAIGPLFAGKLADTLGRKKTLLLLAVPFLTGYIILAFARGAILYYIARFIIGLSVGSTFAVLPMYLGEITEDHNRGKFGCSFAVLVTIGIIYPLAVGPLLTIKVFNFSCAVPLMLFVIFFGLFIPESPVYLMSIGNTKEAGAALRKLRNKTSSQLEKEILKISQDLEKNSAGKGGIGELFKQPPLRKGLTITLGLAMLQQFAGINAVMAFLGPIFEATGSGISTYVSTIIIGTIQIFATVLTSAIVEKLGRKLLLLVSTIGSCSSILLLGLYFYLKNNTVYNVDKLFWLPVVCLMVYIVTFNIGLGPLPWTIMGELFPAHVKSVASALTSGTCFLAGFGVTLVFPIIVKYVGMAQCFWLFGSFCVLGIVFIFAVVPETKGKSLAEIQEILSGN